MRWTIDSAHSAVEFSVKHMMISTVKGKFTEVQGVFDFIEDDADHDGTTVEATIPVTSITTGDPRRDGHLQSPDFFDAATYPNITFKSTKVEKTGDTEFKVTGDLTIHGVTKPATLDVEYNGQSKNPMSGSTHAGFTAKTSISRKDFGLEWNVALETGGVLVGDKINIALDIEGVAAPVAAAV